MTADSQLDPAALAHARRLLAPPPAPSRTMAALAAAAFAALSTLALATTVVLTPLDSAAHHRTATLGGQGR